ncbi:MAG: LysR substrate-binding domain-containing protein, partial [Bradyrhizobium sp.]|nr:LysR substrate-binding domain-containing protein [Bradyrhizobium sp.]
FRAGCTYRQRLEQVFNEFGWPAAARIELGTLDGMIGCVAAGMGVALLPRAVVTRHEMIGSVGLHTLTPSHARVDTLFIHRRAAHRSSALSAFMAGLAGRGHDIAA